MREEADRSVVGVKGNKEQQQQPEQEGEVRRGSGQRYRGMKPITGTRGQDGGNERKMRAPPVGG